MSTGTTHCEREIQKNYRMEHSTNLPVETVMLDSKASDLDKTKTTRPNLKKMGAITLQGIVTILLVALRGVSATNHSVGGPSGWDPSSNVQVWSAANTFHVGDTLVFKYSPTHDVLEVNELDYIKCCSINPINIDNNGDTIVHLTQPGTHYFISGRNADCTMGLKFSIDVLPLANEGLAGRIFPRTPRRPPIHRPPLSRIHRPPPSMPDLDLPLPLPPPVMVFPPPGSETMSPEASPSSSGIGGIMMARCLDSLFQTMVVFTVNYLFF